MAALEPSDRVRVGIAGAVGRMGRALICEALNTPEISLGAASCMTNNEMVVGRDAGLHAGAQEASVAISGSLEYCVNDFDVCIDFTDPDNAKLFTALCVEHDKGLVIGTTGYLPEQRLLIKKAAEKIPVVMASNMSVGVNLLLRTVRRIARALGMEADVDILEMHHREKRDTPSGTSLVLAAAVAEGRGQVLEENMALQPLKTGESRAVGRIQMHSMRLGDVVGEHRIVFTTKGERLELIHRASSRQTFASGAMMAAQWVVKQPPGLYSMQDVLEIE